MHQRQAHKITVRCKKIQRRKTVLLYHHQRKITMCPTRPCSGGTPGTTTSRSSSGGTPGGGSTRTTSRSNSSDTPGERRITSTRTSNSSCGGTPGLFVSTGSASRTKSASPVCGSRSTPRTTTNVHAGNPRCPVSSYEKYISKLNGDLERLWQRPKLEVNESDDVWSAINRLVLKNCHHL